ncbi:hypothetical protein [Marinobacter salsuginis]|jgi:DNA repair ATPase RecN|uniref:Uncharacterized protein n=1 Tax=Marinobacter salsuginis TaxID=418719 RepID=A0A5M3Q0T2_9GAMM|nr:hypothetical protein [Marinobacter salsuginis]GBO88651.1 hypothetical protein MSSD14B_23190 [Marinobacter salsuginis]
MNVDRVVEKIELAHANHDAELVKELTQSFKLDLYKKCSNEASGGDAERFERFRGADEQWQEFEEKLSHLGYSKLPSLFRDLVAKNEPSVASQLGWL